MSGNIKRNTMAKRQEILAWCDQLLASQQFKDYAPNGLQVEGAEDVQKIVLSVTASLAAIEYAIQQNAQMLLVHHGMFWKSEPITITGWKKQRIAQLLAHQINMVAYHLPLDAHPELGNNAQLAKLLGWQTDYCCGEQNLLNIGHLPSAQTIQQIAEHMEQQLGRQVISIGDNNKSIQKIAWCTGGAQGFFQQAIEEGVELFVTGEISEAQFHLAQETGVAFISAGHHATERYGIQALGEACRRHFSVEVSYFDDKNPA